MVNLNECKFGDRLRTRDGRLAIYCEKSENDNHILMLESPTRGFMIVPKYNDNGECKFFSQRSEGRYDILNKFDDDIEYTRRNAPGEPDYLAPILINK